MREFYNDKLEEMLATKVTSLQILFYLNEDYIIG